MSRNDWERGTVKLPAAAWRAARDALVQAHNSRQDMLLKLAQDVHARLKAVKAQGKPLTGTLSEMLNDDPAGRELLAQHERLGAYGLDFKLLGGHPRGGARNLIKPTRASFPLAQAAKVNEIGDSEFQIEFDQKARTLTWVVHENNRAVDRARRSHMGAAFFRVLAGVTWTRGTGGQICGNDEYNREARGEGEGSNYVTGRFGPLGGSDARSNLSTSARRRKAKPVARAGAY